MYKLPLAVGLTAAFAATAGMAADGSEIRINIAGVKSVQPTVFTAAPVNVMPQIYDEPETFIPEPDFAVGSELPLDYMMLFDVRAYDLPPPQDGWVYFEVGRSIYRVNLNSRTVLEKMSATID